MYCGIGHTFSCLVKFIGTKLLFAVIGGIISHHGNAHLIALHRIIGKRASYPTMDQDSESTVTSIDENTENLCDNPTRDTLADGLINLFKPVVDQLDDRVRTTRYVLSMNFDVLVLPNLTHIVQQNRTGRAEAATREFE